MLCAVLFIYSVGLGVYQVQNLVEFVPNASVHWDMCNPENNRNYNDMMCSHYHDRFGSIALGVIVPLILYPALPVFLITRKIPPSGKRMAIISIVTFIITLMVPLSGIWLYYNLGR